MSTSRTVGTYASYFVAGAFVGGFSAMFITRLLNNCGCSFIDQHAYDFNCTVNYNSNLQTGMCFSDCFHNQTNYENLMHAYNKDCTKDWSDNNYVVIAIVAIIGGCMGMAIGKRVVDFSSKAAEKLNDSAAYLLGVCFGFFSRRQAVITPVYEIELAEQQPLSLGDSRYQRLN